MLKKEKFVEKLGTWFPLVEQLFDNGIMDGIYDKLKEESLAGFTVTPHSDNTFRCFKETPVDTLKVVMMGFCPYHSIVHGKMVADGLLMGCSNHENYIAPSLQQYYSAIEEEFKDGLCLPCLQTGDLSYLCTQGVLMFNSSLTTRVGVAGAHQDLWRPFTEHLMGIFNKKDIPVVFLGNDAWGYSDYNNLHFKLAHPASASRQHKQWDSQGIFKKVNEKLEDWYQAPIKWILETPPF